MPTNDSHTASHDGCNECPLVPDRRDFLRRSAATVGAALLALGASSRTASALAVAARALVPLNAGDAAGRATKVYAIPAADGVQIDRDSEVILVRWLGSVFAFALSCPHQNTPLKWIEKEEHFQCPKHRSEYAADGYFMSGRATRGMDRYAVRRDGNNVVVDLAVLRKESDDAKAWEASCITL